MVLTDAERTALETLVRAHTTGQQLAQRAQIMLAAAAGQSNSAIGRMLGLETDTVRRWRGRWVAHAAREPDAGRIAPRLADAPRSGAPARITAAQVCRIVALAYAAPRTTGRPTSQWTGRELADEVRAQVIVDQISPRHVGRLLKKGICSRIAYATG